MKRVLLFVAIILVLSGGFYFFTKEKAEVPINGFLCKFSETEFKKSVGMTMTQETKDKYFASIEKINALEDGYEKYFNLGMQYRNLDDLEESCLMFLKSIEYDEHYLAYSALGTVYLEREDYVQAEKAWLKALEQNSQDINTYKKLGSLYFPILNNYPDYMYKYYNDSIIATGGNVELTKQYAEYLERINDLQYALAIWEGIMEKEGESEYVAERIEKVKERIAE